MTRTLRASTTTAFIWSNYREDHVEVKTRSLAFLGNELIQYLGLPLNRYQTFLETFEKSSRGLGEDDLVLGPDGQQATRLSDDQTRAIDDQWQLEYDVTLGKNYSGSRLAAKCGTPAN